MEKIKPCLAANETDAAAGETQLLEINGRKVTISYAKSGNSNVLPQISRTLLEAASQKKPDDNLHDSE